MPDICKHTEGLKYAPNQRSDFETQFIQQLIERRHQLNLSQRYVNESIGVAEGLLAKWETGLRSPSGYLLFCWAEALQCRIKVEPNDK